MRRDVPDIVNDIYEAINGAHRSVSQDHDLLRRAAKEIKRLRADRACFICAECNGDGVVPKSYGFTPCPACEGTGH